MSVLTPFATWPLARGCIQASYTCSHGVSPGAAMFVMPAQPVGPPASVGTLRITDGSGRLVRLPGCRIDKIHPINNGAVWEVVILDRRWAWQYGGISGLYNARDDDGELVRATVRSAAQLAALCLEAMGETNYSVEGMPTDEFPAVDWAGDTASVALESLASQFGCRVVYRPSSDSALVVKLGVGLTLPDLPAITAGVTLDFPENPDTILLLGGPTEWEILLPLEAVGLDIDGEVKPIGKLLYAPAAPHEWDRQRPPGFHSLKSLKPNPKYEEATQADLDEKVKLLAEQTVYRWYRVVMERPDGSFKPLFIPGYGEVKDRFRVIISDRRVATGVSTDGTLVAKPAEVRGRFSRYKQVTRAANDSFGNSVPSEVIGTSFSIDPARGLVMFSDPVFKYDVGRFWPADLVLRCAVQVREPETHAVVRYSQTLTVGAADQLGTKPEVVRRPEVALKVAGRYALRGDFLIPKWELLDYSSNAATVDAAATTFLAICAARYNRETPQDVTYAGIYPLAPDGAIQQITWSVGGGGPPTTTVSRNGEHAHRLPGFEELRRIRFTRELLKPAEPPNAQRAMKAMELPGELPEDRAWRK